MAGASVESALAEMGLFPTVSGGEARARCPLCPGEKTGESLAVNVATGAWKCHRCGEAGNIFTLRRRIRGGASAVAKAVPDIKVEPAGRVIPDEMVSILEAELRDSPQARAYLEGARRLRPETWTAARLGFDPGRGPGGAVSIPYFLGGICVGIKYRRLPPGDTDAKYDREPGCVLPLYGQDDLEGGFARAVIVEGELDRLALRQMGCTAPVVSLPDGAAAALKEGAKAALVPFDEIVLALDADKAGDDGAVRIAGEIGRFRCRRARLPRKDAGDCLRDGVGPAEVMAAIDASAFLAESLVKPVGAWSDVLLAPPANPRGWSTGHAGLDRLLGGYRGGEVTLLTAETGHGKTTLCIDLLRRVVEAGRGALLVPLETGGKSASRKMLSAVAGRIWDKIPSADLPECVGRLCSMPAYILDRYGDITIGLLRDEIAYAVRRHGVEFVIIDHLHFALGVRKAGEDERLLIDAVAHAVQTTALSHGIHVILVMHPAKIRPGEDGKQRTPGIGDLKGSSGPAQFADNVAVLNRGSSGRATLELKKVRSELGKPGKVDLIFDPETLRFSEL